MNRPDARLRGHDEKHTPAHQLSVTSKKAGLAWFLPFLLNFKRLPEN
jgi:hypothetical protein